MEKKIILYIQGLVKLVITDIKIKTPSCVKHIIDSFKDFIVLRVLEYIARRK